MPIATGMAIKRDNPVVIAVPKRFVAAPNDPFTAFQSVEKMNWKTPNFAMARDDSENST